MGYLYCVAPSGVCTRPYLRNYLTASTDTSVQSSQPAEPMGNTNPNHLMHYLIRMEEGLNYVSLSDTW